MDGNEILRRMQALDAECLSGIYTADFLRMMARQGHFLRSVTRDLAINPTPVDIAIALKRVEEESRTT